MKRFSLIAVIVLLGASSCVNRRYSIVAHAKVDAIEQSIHEQFYAALQSVNLGEGINIVPQNLSVKFDHTVTTNVTGGFTAFSIVAANYQYQNIQDNSVTDILAPTKVSTSSPAAHDHNLVRATDTTLEIKKNTCVFDPEQSSSNQAVINSIKNLKAIIEEAATTFAKVPNMGVLNDHQITVDIKFTYSNDGNISVNPLFTYLFFTKINLKFDKNIASTDDMQFTFDVVENDQNFVSNTAYNKMRSDMIASKGGICGFFPTVQYTNDNVSKYLVAPPVQDQHTFNSCVAYAVGYTCLSTILKSDDKPFDSGNEYSPDFIYARLTSNTCGGLDLPNVLNEVVKEGDCTVKDFPLVADMKCETYRDQPHRDKIATLLVPAQGILKKVTNGWLPLDPNNIDQIRLCLDNNEPVIVAFYESNSFTNMWDYGDPSLPKRNIWKTQSGPYTDAHCVCIIGYDNVTKLFKVQNSWGKTNSAGKIAGNDAEAGYFWVTYDLVQRGCFKEAYTFLPKG